MKARTRYKSEGSDDEVTGRDLVETVPRGAALAIEVDLLKHDVLVQVDTVEAGEDRGEREVLRNTRR